MRISKAMTVSLPPTMVDEFEKVRKAENRTCSELVREALHLYFSTRAPEAVATKAELAAIRRGREAYARGDYVSLEELLHDLEHPSRRASPKRPASATSKRAKAR